MNKCKTSDLLKKFTISQRKTSLHRNSKKFSTSYQKISSTFARLAIMNNEDENLIFVTG